MDQTYFKRNKACLLCDIFTMSSIFSLPSLLFANLSGIAAIGYEKYSKNIMRVLPLATRYFKKQNKS